LNYHLALWNMTLQVQVRLISFLNRPLPFRSQSINTKGWYLRKIWGSSSWLKIHQLILTSKRIWKKFKGINLVQQEHYSFASMTQQISIRPRLSNFKSHLDLTINHSITKLNFRDLVTTTILMNQRCHTVIYKSRLDLSQIDTKRSRQDQELIDSKRALDFIVWKSHHHHRQPNSLSPIHTLKSLT